MSLAEAAPGVTWALLFPVHSATIAAGQVMLGGVVSCTCTDEEQEALFVDGSLAE